MLLKTYYSSKFKKHLGDHMQLLKSHGLLMGATEIWKKKVIILFFEGFQNTVTLTFSNMNCNS